MYITAKTPTSRIICGSANAMPVRDKSVHCIVTSPPYYGLRAYGGPGVVFGGKQGCAHEWVEQTYSLFGGDTRDIVSPGKVKGQTIGAHYGQVNIRALESVSSLVCEKCGAWRGQLGLEMLHDCLSWAKDGSNCGRCYICHMREIAAECYRVLRDDGTLWIVIGDTYNRGKPREDKIGNNERPGKAGPTEPTRISKRPMIRMKIPGLTRKDLLMIPGRLALSLQADGWVLRNDVVWFKGYLGGDDELHPTAPPEPVRDRLVKAHEIILLFSKRTRYYFDHYAIQEEAVGGGYRNRRDVWGIQAQTGGANHLAAFPEGLPALCIRAGASWYTCGKCGAPARPVYGGDDQNPKPTCKCAAGLNTGAAVVLDPFAGSGTTGVAAVKWGRSALLLDVVPVGRHIKPKGQSVKQDWKGTLFENLPGT